MTEEEKAERRQEMLEKIKHFRLIDDTFMSKVLEESPECVQLILHIILNKPDLTVKKLVTQYALKNLQGRSARLDVYAEDSAGKKYNIEIQRANKGAGARRARYNLSLMDANSLISGEETEQLPETYVIFINENDVLGLGEPLYIIERVIKGKDTDFNDGSHIIYVNGACREGISPLALLMQDFFCAEPDRMNYKLLAKRTKFFKEDETGVVKMCKIMEELFEEFAKEDNHRQAREFANRLLMLNKNSYQEIADCSGLTLAEVMELAGQKSA